MLNYKELIVINKELLIKIIVLKNKLIKEREDLKYVISKRKKQKRPFLKI